VPDRRKKGGGGGGGVSNKVRDVAVVLITELDAKGGRNQRGKKDTRAEEKTYHPTCIVVSEVPGKGAKKRGEGKHVTSSRCR